MKNKYNTQVCRVVIQPGNKSTGRNLRPEHTETVQEYVLELCRLQTDNITLPKALGHDGTRSKTKPTVW